MSFDSSRPAKSGTNSKRSFNSINSNINGSNSNSNSNSNGNSKKKKKKEDSGQQTLGMAWGSNSRSSSRSSFCSSPFTDFGSYMAVKNRKLHEQFNAEASSSSHGDSGSTKPVFSGVSIFVDGYTVPSSQELRSYMLKHGGRFENYFSRHRVTHIICSNLPNSKIKNLRSFSGGLPVVKPTWVLDSVAANKLLSWVPYQLDQLASETNNQPKLSAFLSSRSNQVSVNDPTTGGMASDAYTYEVSESTEDIKQLDRRSDTFRPDHCDEIKVPTCSNSCGEEVSEPSNVAADRTLVETQSKCSPSRPSASDGSCCLDNHNIKESPSMVTGSSNQGHSTLADPNFVESYFKNSRLHFIGTWRNRYRKRFAGSSDGLRSSSSVSASHAAHRDAIIHVDMDCFFVSVVIRNRPELLDRPVAVCHSDNPRGTAEISSANYPARDHGVKAGIFVRDAKALCPHLVIVPYCFEAYEEVADQFYSILHKHCNKVQAMSCDEAILDVTDSEVDDPLLLASMIRKEIFATTGCTASAGISGNMLMARLATRAAKPDGQCYLPLEKVDEFLNNLPIKVLPGIGRALEDKLKRIQVKTCGELRMISKESLQKDFGAKTGDMLWNYCRGIDNRPVGVIQSQHFVMNLCKEVSLRLQGCGVRGRTFTLKVKKRKTDEEPTKYMGCGDCDNLSHSLTVPMATDDVDVLQRITTQIFGNFHIDVKDIRGMGLQVTKLESADNIKQGNDERRSIRNWLASASVCTRGPLKINPSGEKFNRDSKEQIDYHIVRSNSSSSIGANLSNWEARSIRTSDIPPLSDLDMEVLASLPPELFSEINDMYGGKLTSFVLKHKCEGVDVTSSTLNENVVGVTDGERSPCQNLAVFIDDEGRHYGTKELQLPPVPATGIADDVTSSSAFENVGVMPTSLSQIDVSVLQQLPEELRADILEQLPAHRRSELVSNATLGPRHLSPQELSNLDYSMVRAEQRDSVPINKLWVGNPPQWVDKFKFSNSHILKVVAEMYSRLGSRVNFSSVLLQSMSATELFIGGNSDEYDDVISCLCELLKQYVELKIELDMEEIYTCFRLLRRLSCKSELLSQVYNTTLPHLQAAVRGKYGGSFHI